MAQHQEAALEGDAYAMDRYSRQIGAYGVEAMAKLIKMRVLIIGLRGVGVEIAKNLILAGPGGVTVADDNVTAIRDLGSNFFLRESDVGKKTRAAACAPHLQALNRLVEVKAHSGPVTKELVRAHTAVVMCGASRKDALKWDSFARLHKIGFFAVGVHGLFGYAFADLGEEFLIKDRSGENPVSRIIDGIDTLGAAEPNEMIVHLLPPPDGPRHNIDDDAHVGWVTFEEVEGQLGNLINGKGPFRAHHVQDSRVDPKSGKTVQRFNAYALRVVVEGVTSLPAFEGVGGQLTQVKVAVVEHYRALDANLEQPVAPNEFGMMFTDGAKFGRGEQLHAALQGLWEWQERNGGRWPVPNADADTDGVLAAARARNAAMQAKSAAAAAAAPDGPSPCLALEELDEDVVRMAAQHADCEFQPLCAFFGGVVAQEVVKMTGKFTPLRQWLHVDCFEVLPELLSEPKLSVSTADRAPRGTRYDDLVAIIGRPLHEQLMRKSTFMVGCGALGCELIKNFALLGVACSPDGAGVLTVTDNDRIEVSNLSRQFLFRESNVGQPKSAAAGEAVRDMNPALRVDARQDLVGPDTEHLFTDAFWEKQDFITNALDNVKARVYVDAQCVFYGKPLLESGTLGTKCNCQVVVPNLTCSYADGPKDDDSGDAIPMCTLRNFPANTEHCAEWARARFEDLFSTAATEASNFLADPEAWLAAARGKTLELPEGSKRLSAVETELPPTRAVVHVLSQAASPDMCFVTCVKEAHAIFFRLFRDPILSLIRTYPQDAKDRQGNPFWSAGKRFPVALDFNADDETHMGFVMAAAQILAVNYGLQPADQPLPADHPWRDATHVRKMVGALPAPPVVEEKVDMTGGGEDDAGNSNDNNNNGSAGMEVDEDAAFKEMDALLGELEALRKAPDQLLQEVSVEPAEFEKDDDSNGHIDLIVAAANLRAINYRIPPAPRHKIKMIAGKIIPALATTTACVTGLVMVEMLKVAQPGKLLAAFKDSSNSLGINGYFFSEPQEPEKAKDEYDPVEMSEVTCLPPGFTKWDQTVLREGALTLRGFMDAFLRATGVHCTELMHPNGDREGAQGQGKFLYEKNAWQKEMKAEYAARLDRQLEQLVLEVYGEAALPPGKKFTRLNVSCENENGDACRVPQVVYYFA